MPLSLTTDVLFGVEINMFPLCVSFPEKFGNGNPIRKNFPRYNLQDVKLLGLVFNFIFYFITTTLTA